MNRPYRIALEAIGKRLTAKYPFYTAISDRIIFLTEGSHCSDCKEADVASTPLTSGIEGLQAKLLKSTQTWSKVMLNAFPTVSG